MIGMLIFLFLAGWVTGWLSGALAMSEHYKKKIREYVPVISGDGKGIAWKARAGTTEAGK